MTPRRSQDLTRITLGVLFIGALLGASLWILQPFIGATIWATMVVVATWQPMLRLQGLMWGRRSLAVTVMTLLLLLLFVVPLTLAVVTIAGNADRMAEWGQFAADYHLPETPPAWAVSLPMVGGLIERAWEQANDLGLRDLLPRLSPYAGGLTRWFLDQVGNVGFLTLQFLLTVVIAAVLYSTGEDAARLVRRFAVRLGGQRGAEVVALAGAAIRGVAMGVGVTAVVQAVLSGLVLALAGVPFAGLLTAVIFMFCLAQVGPVPVLVPVVVWAFWTDSTGLAIFLSLYTVFVANLDNVLRPMLIRMGADLSLLLIFSGVIGGLVTFGLVGIFIGPVVLAVAWKLLESWMDDGDEPPPPQAYTD